MIQVKVKRANGLSGSAGAEPRPLQALVRWPRLNLLSLLHALSAIVLDRGGVMRRCSNLACAALERCSLPMTALNLTDPTCIQSCRSHSCRRLRVQDPSRRWMRAQARGVLPPGPESCVQRKRTSNGRAEEQARGHHVELVETVYLRPTGVRGSSAPRLVVAVGVRVPEASLHSMSQPRPSTRNNS